MDWKDWLRLVKAVAKALVVAKVTGSPVPFHFSVPMGGLAPYIQGEVGWSATHLREPEAASVDLRASVEQGMEEAHKEHGLGPAHVRVLGVASDLAPWQVEGGR